MKIMKILILKTRKISGLIFEKDKMKEEKNLPFNNQVYRRVS